MDENEEVIEHEEVVERGENRWIGILLIGVLGGAGLLFFITHPNVFASEKVSLSAQEKTQAMSIAERRQQIGFKRQEAQNQFTAQMNRFAEEENTLNVEAAKLCFEMKKAHKLPPNANYWLNEWAGELEKR